MTLRYLSILLILLFLAENCFAQLTPEQAIEEMGRGINLGNTLEPPFEGSWNNGPAQESYFDAYLEAGFKNIRIPVRWDKHTANSAPFAINESWMNRVEEVVDWGLSRGFYVTLNGHHEDWLKNSYNNATFRARYDSIWVQVAERFKDKSDSLLFEIINEPNGMTVGQVDDLNERILGIIRETNPTRIVIYGGNMYANAEQLFDAQIPQDDYIVGYYHSYDPWQFSGQGQGTWGTANDYQQITNKYNAVKNWSNTNNIPIHHSEFGAVHTCDFNSRMRIYAHNVEQCVVNGFAFSVWDDGGDFGILQRSTNSWPEVKDILMHYHEDSPNQIFSNFAEDPISGEPTIVLEWNNRTTENGDIIIERSDVVSNDFQQIAIVESDASSFVDFDVEAGISYTYRMYTTKTDGTLLHGYPTRIKLNATQQSPFKGFALEIPGELEVEDYDLGGEGLAYHDSDPANIPNGFRVDEGVDIGASGNAFILEYVESGEWIEYTVNVTEAGTYEVKGELASQVANGTFTIEFEKNGAMANFISPNTGNWYSFQAVDANNSIELEAGEQIMRLNITNNNAFNIDKLIFSLSSSTNTDGQNLERQRYAISPNPTQGVIHIKSIEPNKTFRFAELYSHDGKKLKTFEVKGSDNSINIESFANGNYMLKILDHNGESMHRIIKID